LQYWHPFWGFAALLLKQYEPETFVTLHWFAAHLHVHVASYVPPCGEEHAVPGTHASVVKLVIASLKHPGSRYVTTRAK
jgi:hypothetical protein